MIIHCLSKLWKTYFHKTPTKNKQIMDYKIWWKKAYWLEEYKRIEHVSDGDIFPLNPKYSQKDNKRIRVWDGKNLL